MKALLLLLVNAVHAARPVPGTLGKLRLVDQAQHPLAAALDGSPPAYYVRHATVATSVGKWLVFFSGGDFCGYGNTEKAQLLDCYRRSKTDLGSSNSYQSQTWLNMTEQSDLFDANDVTNPLLHDWNWVYVPYLDGGYYAGARLTTPIVNDTALHFRGSFNTQAIMAELADSDGLHAATDIVVSGCSSGGVAVFANADNWHVLLHALAPHAKVRGLVDSGYYLDVKTTYWTLPVLTMQNLSTLNIACLAAHRKTPWKCIVAEVVAPFIEHLPVFAWQSRFDANQLECVQIDPKDTQAVRAYGAKLLRSITSWIAVGSGSEESPRGAFVDACYRHCGSSAGIAAYGRSPKHAFNDWYYDPSSLGGAVVQPGRYPCVRCCDQSASEVLVI